MEKKCKKAKWLSGEALQIAVKRREVTSKGEKERYKHLIERVTEELWTEVHDIVQDTGIKTISKKKKCKKAKWLSEEALQIAEKRREAKGKREKERYILSI